MRGVLILLTTGACSQIFGIDTPELVVDAAPADTITSTDAPPPSDGVMSMTFQQGLNNYAGARDTFIDIASPGSSKETDSLARIRMDERWGLLAFSSIFGPAWIPQGAELLSATLHVRIQSLNCVGAIADVAVAWNDSVTYNTFGLVPGVQTSDHGALFASLASSTETTSIDVLASAKLWQSSNSNNGWIFIATGGNECAFRTSDDGSPSARPRLVITYTP